jgi:hypothetical protein
MPSGFDTKELTVLTWLDNIIALAEAGDESAWTRIADLWAGRHGVGGLSRHDADRAAQLVGGGVAHDAIRARTGEGRKRSFPLAWNW